MYPYTHPLVSTFRRVALLPLLAYGSLTEDVEKTVRLDTSAAFARGVEPAGRYDIVIRGDVQLEGGVMVATKVEGPVQRITRMFYWRCFLFGVSFLSFWYGLAGGVAYYIVVKKMEEAEEEAMRLREEAEKARAGGEERWRRKRSAKKSHRESGADASGGGGDVEDEVVSGLGSDEEQDEDSDEGYLPDWTSPPSTADPDVQSDDEFVPTDPGNHPNRNNRTRREEEILLGKVMRGEGRDTIFVDRDEADPDE